MKIIKKILFFLILSDALLAHVYEDRGNFFNTQTKETIESIFNTFDNDVAFYIKTFSDSRNQDLRTFVDQEKPTENKPWMMVLVIKNPKKVFMFSSKSLSGRINPQDIELARKKLLEQFKDQNFDDGILDAVNFLTTKYLTTALNVSENKRERSPFAQEKGSKIQESGQGTSHDLSRESSQNTNQGVNEESSNGFSFSTFVIIISAIFGLFFLMNKFKNNRSNNQRGFPLENQNGRRSFSSQNNHPQQHPSQHYSSSQQQYPNQYQEQQQGPMMGQAGGSGRGFLSTMAAGMFGAAAGHWMYDSFFGSSAHAKDQFNDSGMGSTGHDSLSSNAQSSYSSSSQNNEDSYMAGDFSSHDDWSGSGDSGSGDSGGSDW